MAMDRTTTKLVPEIISEMRNKSLICNNLHQIRSKNVWSHGNPLQSPTTLLLLQLSVISVVSHTISLCLKPLGLGVVSQIFAGIVLGPSILGNLRAMAFLFPARGMIVIETMSKYGFMFYLFEMGVKMDSNVMIQPGRQALIVGLSVFMFTLFLSFSLHMTLRKFVNLGTVLDKSLFHVVRVQASIGFPYINALLTDLKMLNSDIGRLALSSSLFCDAFGIFAAVVFISITESKDGGVLTPVLAILSSAALVAAIVCAIRPAIQWTLNHVSKGKSISELFIWSIFILINLVGLLSELVGQHFTYGPLILGLAVPTGSPLGVALLSKLDTFASQVFFPVYLAFSGLRTNIFTIHFQAFWVMGIVICFASLVKLGAAMLPAVYTGMPVREAFVLGLIINTKGIVEIMLYNILKDTKVMGDEEFAISALSVIVVTAIITPLIKVLYDPSKQYIKIKRTSIHHTKHDTDLRILVCIHNEENVPTIINLLQVSNASEESNITAIALILVELLGSSTPVLVAHQPYASLPTSITSTNRIVNAFRQYENQNQGLVNIEPFTSICPFETMYNDIFRVAFDKRATIVILPFHKQWAIGGSTRSTNRAIRTLNINVLKTAPCSVGILIDRGILTGSISHLTSQPLYHIAVIYIGGEDDAESLAYGSRMSREESVDLTVVRFIIPRTESNRGKMRDSNLIDEYQNANAGNERFVIVEEEVKDGDDLVSSIKEMTDCFDLILVGRRHPTSPILTRLGVWTECPELGVIGDILASSDFGGTTSVLVVQKQRYGLNLTNHGMPLVTNDRG